ncbi:hypothetical protein LPJGGPFB_02532 [Ensifer adhaerens]|uniref:hypothetical protein n=1 Tax=Ensifer adhaerens TaxID=106592 RepID=UPI001568665C|nr:hypothetical protein [Ensifer adhaerens]NRP19277.1 hypothetical protein [Ensifer adhaerens]
MARRETGDAAAHLNGGKPYQEKAKQIFPLLVRQALARHPLYYSDLAPMVDMPNPRNLNYPLGSVGTSIAALAKKWGTDIPPIQCLVLNKGTGLPGEGIGWFIKGSKDAFNRLSKGQKQKLVDSVLHQIYAFPRWPEVLEALQLHPVGDDFSGLVAAARSSGRGGGEGPGHKRLKEFVFNNSGLFGFSSPKFSEMERKIASADCLDVSFASKDRWLAVEVKSAISSDGDLTRGIFQCVKYKAVMAAEVAACNDDKAVDAVLVTEGPLSPTLRALAITLGVTFYDNIVPEQSPKTQAAA